MRYKAMSCFPIKPRVGRFRRDFGLTIAMKQWMAFTAPLCPTYHEHRQVVGTNSGAQRTSPRLSKNFGHRTSKPGAIFKFGIRNFLCSEVVFT